MKILVINGANMNMLGVREPEKYGNQTLKDIEQNLVDLGKNLGVEVECFQSNFEGEIIGKIHSAYANFDGIIINPGAYTHTSVAIRDAISAVSLPTVEVHMTNIYEREDFRQKSVTAPVCVGQICGFGHRVYELALSVLTDLLK